MKLKLMGEGHEIFSEKITGPWNIQVYGLLGHEKFFEKFLKPSGPLSYVLNVCSLIAVSRYNYDLNYKHGNSS